MPGTHENGSGESRLDRMERLMAGLAEGHAGSTRNTSDCSPPRQELTETLDRLIAEQKKRPEQPN